MLSLFLVKFSEISQCDNCTWRFYCDVIVTIENSSHSTNSLWHYRWLLPPRCYSNHLFHDMTSHTPLRWRETTWREVTCPRTEGAFTYYSGKASIPSYWNLQRTELTSISCHVTVCFKWVSCALWIDPVLPVLLCVGVFPNVLAGDSREVRRWAFFSW